MKFYNVIFAIVVTLMIQNVIVLILHIHHVTYHTLFSVEQQQQKAQEDFSGVLVPPPPPPLVLKPQETQRVVVNDNDTARDSRNHTTSSVESSFPAIQCMHKLEQTLPSLIDQWYENYVPIPYSVKIIHDQFYVLTSVLHIPIKDQVPWRKARVQCNGYEGRKVLHALERLGRPTLIVQCGGGGGSSVDGAAAAGGSSSDGATAGGGSDGTTGGIGGGVRLETLSFFLTRPNQNDTQQVEVSYNISLLDECERLDLQYFSNVIIASPPNVTTSIGLTTSFKGNRNRTLEWATYHHMIGVDHVWIYVNEPWDSLGTQSLPYRDFITWIPFNFSIAHDHFRRKHNYIPTEHFRIASQNDALWRAKRMGLAWLAIVDLDEYMVVECNDDDDDDDHRHFVQSQSQSSCLKTYLTQKFDHDQRQRFGAVEMNSVPFGRNVDVDNVDNMGSGSGGGGAAAADLGGDSDLWIRYTWRPKGDLNALSRHRMKLIVNPQKVTSVNIHYIGGGDRTGVQVWSAPTSELRIHHYRNPREGVFDQKHGTLATWDLQQDTSLRDRYHDLVLEQLRKGS